MTHHVQLLGPRRLLAAGQLDATFGTGGAVAYRVDQRDVIRWVAEAPDGKIVAAVTTSYGSNGKLHIRRMNPDGSPDLTFGGGDGDVLTTGPQHAQQFAMAPDGRIAISEYDTVLVLSADGTPDERFGPDGRFDPSATLKASDEAFSGLGAIAPAWTLDNKLVFAGAVGLDKTAVVRLNADGSVDASFGGGDGVAGTADAAAQGTPIAVTGDGTVLVPASKFTMVENPANEEPFVFYDRDVYMLRFDASGTQQSSHVLFHGRSQEQAYYADVTRAPDGSVVAVSATPVPGVKHAYAFSLERFSVDGQRTQQVPLARQLNGSATVHVGAGSDARAIVIGGVPEEAVYLQRYDPDGTLDTSYGGTGVVNANRPAPAEALFRLFGAVTRDGDAIVAEKRVRTLAGTAYDFVFARYVGGGPALGATLNSRGTLTVQTGAGSDDVSLGIRSDGRLAVRRNGAAPRSFPLSRVKRINILTAGGNDRVTLGAGVRGARIDGGAGNDTINGSADTDVLIGGSGRDQLFGFDGDDLLYGGGGSDYLLGGAGRDELFGQAGADTLSGAGGNDRLVGGSEIDRAYGGSGSDAADGSDDEVSYFDVEVLLA
ncbi:MAG TPA: hypothetical protein VER17_01555 [Tepidisphaeraceae bacterium]|nr:hypothetical protein [Tepidisphaeraceae bacterium]